VTSRRIDLNADVGERPEALADGSEAELIACVTSINVACGGHAGTPASMAALVALARRHGVALGAHPSYPDRDGFGRRALDIDAGTLQRAIASQVQALAEVAAADGAILRHVKPHGALYNVAARDAGLAATIAIALAAWRSDVVLVGLAGSVMLDIWRRAGFATAAEAFVDRRYEPDGSLRARNLPDAVITDPRAAAEQAVEIAAHGTITAVGDTRLAVAPDTLCMHGDTPNAIDIARAVRTALTAHGVTIRSLAGA
jgi:UPF0271 protein